MYHGTSPELLCGLGFHLNLEGSDNDMTLTVMVFLFFRFALALVFIVCQQPTNSKVRAITVLVNANRCTTVSCPSRPEPNQEAMYKNALVSSRI